MQSHCIVKHDALKLPEEEIVERNELATSEGIIVYYVSRAAGSNRPWLVFLPGLTADHRLFDKQVEYFEGKANLLVWDAPSHGESRPFDLDWTLDGLARWLKEILDSKGIADPILIGQSLGGYIAQTYMELYPGTVRGFVSIDSCSLKREYYSGWELAALRHTKLMFRIFPWKTLVNLGASNNSTSEFGHSVMREMMLSFDKREYIELSAHGFHALADAVAADRAYEIDCPFLLICGTEDNAGSSKRYNREWERRTGCKVHWIEGAGHNSNCDAPDTVSALINHFIEGVWPEEGKNDE